MNKKTFCLFCLTIAAALFHCSKVSPANSWYLALSSSTLAQAEPVDDSRDAALAERFLKILERNPKRGTALDRAYGYFVESGKVEELISRYKDRVKEDENDGAGWMILGLLQAKRGNDEDAIGSFTKAAEIRTEDAFASYYLGQSYALAGQIEEAAKAYESAIKRKPRSTDLLSIYQSLGRLYQRSQDVEKALEVWDRLEKEFPDDGLVKEQIAFTLAEEGQPEEALKRFEALIKDKATDLYRRVQYQIEAANLKVKLSQKQEAIADFESLLSRLKPGSWLHDQVRDKIEQVYRRDDDLSGLGGYYEKWIEKHGDDVSAMSLLARVYSQMGRSAEARQWFAKGIEKAPKNTALRLQYIDELVAVEKYRDAADEYRQLNEIDVNNPDNIQQWGLVVLKDNKKTDAERKKEASEIWMKLVDARKDDPVIATQVADLMRQAGMDDQAIKLYKRAIDIAPERAQFREYLGQFYHQLDRKEEAVATWQKMAAGKLRTPESLQRLAEVFSQFGYKKEAIATSEQACELDKKDFSRNLFLADLYADSGKYTEALEQLQHTKTLASNDEENGGVFDRTLDVYAQSGTLLDEIAKLKKVIDTKETPDEADWQKLARYLAAANQRLDAIEAAEKAIELDEQSISSWRIVAELYEGAGRLEQAADANRKLASLDRRFRTQYLTAVARLEASLGRVDAAIQAGKDLIAAAPGNTENYQFFAELCFRLGKSDDGLNALRRAMRANPSEAEHVLSLAEALTQQYKTHDAIDLYWQALAKSDELQAKLGIVGRMTELYLQIGEFDKLIERLERARVRANDSREASFLIAEAHLDAQNYVTAIEELEALLAKSERDTLLLRQLSVVAERSGDYDLALEYQKKLYSFAPDRSNKNRLAKLFLVAGDFESAEQMWTQILLSEDDFLQVLNSIDRLIGYQRYSTAEIILSDLERQKPGNWEILTRRAAIFGMQNEWEKASKVCNEILKLSIDDDNKSEKARRLAAKKARGKSANSSRYATNATGIVGRTYAAYQIRQFTGIERSRSSASVNPTVWSPMDFGQARMAAIGWLYRCSQTGAVDFNTRFIQGDVEKMSSRDLWDQVYASYVLQQPYTNRTHEVAMKLRETDSPDAHWLAFANTAYGPVGNAPNLLNDEQIELAIESYRVITVKHPEWIEPYFLNNFITKLDRAQKADIGNELYAEAVENASDFSQLSGFMSVAGSRGDTEAIIKLIDRMVQEAQTNRAGITILRYIASYSMNAIGKWETNKTIGDALKVHDHYLSKLRSSPNLYQPASNTSRSAAKSYSVQQVNGRRTSKSLTYPAPNRYYDTNAITMLVNTHELYKRQQKADELYEAFRSREQKTEGVEKIQTLLALSYLSAWDSKFPESVEQLEKARTLDESNSDLTFDLAILRARMGEYTVAMKVLDDLEIADPKLQVEREKSILTWAMKAENNDRAKLAAKRLFGLRLDARYQVTLANAMQKLGMQDYADAVLRRARRRSSNNLTQLVSIMKSYQQKGDVEIAVQVAHQILRRTTGRSNMTTTSSRSSSRQNELKTANAAAVKLLKESGRLDELIKRAEAQLERSPKSEKIMRTLAEYYASVGKKDRSTEMYMKIASLNPRDINLRYQVASSIYSSDKKRGLEMLTSILEDDPSIFIQQNDNILKRYREQKQLALLSKTLIKGDLGKLANEPYRVQSLINEMTKNATLKDDGIDLLVEFWKTFPNYRRYVFQSNNSVEFLKEDRVFALVKKTLLEPQIGVRNQDWSLSNMIIEYGNHAGLRGILNRFIDVVQERDEFDKFIVKLTERVKADSNWKDGQVLLAIASIRKGNVDEGVKTAKSLVADDSAPISGYAVLTIGNELEKTEMHVSHAVALYESNVNSSWYTMANNYDYSPAKRLVYLYKKSGDNLKARNILLRFSEPNDPGYSQPRDLADYRLSRRISIAKELLEFEFPFDAIRVYQKVLDSKGDLAVSSNAKNFVTQAKAGMSQCSEKLTLENVLTFVDEIASADADAEKQPTEIPLFTVTEGSDLQSLRVVSPMLSIALNVDKEHAKQYADLTSSFEPIAQAPQATLSVRMLHSVLGWEHTGPDKRVDLIVGRLTPLIEYLQSTPLEVVEEGKQPSSRQIEAARVRFALFTIAEALIAQERDVSGNAQLFKIADTLSNYALEAAAYADDVRTQQAILFRLGELAAKQKDQQKAKEHWERLLKLILTKPIVSQVYLNRPSPTYYATTINSSPVYVSSGTTITSTIQPPVSTSFVVSQPTPVTVIPASAQSDIISVPQCSLALELAIHAANHGLQELSFKCVADAFEKGWPVRASQQVLVSQPSRVSTFSGSVTFNQPTATVNAPSLTPLLENVVSLWREKKFANSAIYETLSNIVLPKDKPETIYVRNLRSAAAKKSSLRLAPFQSRVCDALCITAIDSKKEDELSNRIKARLDKPAAELYARYLLGILSAKTGDEASIASELSWFEGKLNEKKSNSGQEYSAAIALAALDTKQAPKALKVLRKAVAQRYNKKPEDEYTLAVTQPVMTLVTSQLVGESDSQATNFSPLWKLVDLILEDSSTPSSATEFSKMKIDGFQKFTAPNPYLSDSASQALQFLLAEMKKTDKGDEFLAHLKKHADDETLPSRNAYRFAHLFAVWQSGDNPQKEQGLASLNKWCAESPEDNNLKILRLRAYWSLGRLIAYLEEIDRLPDELFARNRNDHRKHLVKFMMFGEPEEKLRGILEHLSNKSSINWPVIQASLLNEQYVSQSAPESSVGSPFDVQTPAFIQAAIDQKKLDELRAAVDAASKKQSGTQSPVPTALQIILDLQTKDFDSASKNLQKYITTLTATPDYCVNPEAKFLVAMALQNEQTKSAGVRLRELIQKHIYHSVVLKPDSIVSLEGKQFDIQNNGTITLQGDKTKKDEYEIFVTLPKEPISALRLEIRNPGDQVRYTRITTFEVFTEDSQPGKWKPIKLKEAFASFEERGTAMGTIDVNSKTYWRVTKTKGGVHSLIAKLPEPIVGKKLKVVIKHNYGNSYTTRAFRLHAIKRGSQINKPAGEDNQNVPQHFLGHWEKQDGTRCLIVRTEKGYKGLFLGPSAGKETRPWMAGKEETLFAATDTPPGKITAEYKRYDAGGLKKIPFELNVGEYLMTQAAAGDVPASRWVRID